jgi:hypothetical protein
MTFCHECGKLVVPPSAKFCRNCGASQYVEPQLPVTPAATSFKESVREPFPVAGDTSPLPLSRQSNLPPQVVPEPVIPEVWKSCGSLINPDEKYCGCGSPCSEHDFTVPHKQEILTPTPFRVCTICGSPLLETENSAEYAVRVHIVLKNPIHNLPCPKLIHLPLNNPPQPPAMKVCRSCGSPLSGTELFCGICGKPVQSTSPGTSASQQIDGRTCSNCGKPIRVTTGFCGSCRMAVGSR